MGKKIRLIIKFIIFNAILFILLTGANKVLRNKEYEDIPNIYNKQ